MAAQPAPRNSLSVGEGDAAVGGWVQIGFHCRVSLEGALEVVFVPLE